MTHLVPIPFIGAAVLLLIRAEFRSDKRQIYFFKPLSTLLVILVAALSFSTPGVKVGYTAGVLVELVLSLGGDVALIFPSGGAFPAGLIFFLLAHVAYAVTFTLFNGFYPGDLASGGLLLALAVVVYRYLEPGLEKMKGPDHLNVLRRDLCTDAGVVDVRRRLSVLDFRPDAGGEPLPAAVQVSPPQPGFLLRRPASHRPESSFL